MRKRVIAIHNSVAVAHCARPVPSPHVRQTAGTNANRLHGYGGVVANIDGKAVGVMTRDVSIRTVAAGPPKLSSLFALGDELAAVVVPHPTLHGAVVAARDGAIHV